MYQQLVDGDREPQGKEVGYLNLIQYKDRSPEDKKKFHQMGQKAQAEKKRQRKTLKEDLLNILSNTELTRELARESNSTVIEQLAQENKLTVQDLITTATVLQCIQGNTRTLEFLRDTIGEKPKEDINISADVVTSADRSLIEKLRKRLDVVQSDEETEE